MVFNQMLKRPREIWGEPQERLDGPRLLRLVADFGRYLFKRHVDNSFEAQRQPDHVELEIWNA